MKIKNFLSVPRPPGEDETVKKQLATSILEHLIKEGLVPDLSTPKTAPYHAKETASEPETELDH